MSRYITGEYNYGQIIPSVSQIAARISTLHNGLRHPHYAGGVVRQAEQDATMVVGEGF